jgi:hypothetical protein
MALTTTSLVSDDKTDPNEPEAYNNNKSPHPLDPGEKPFENEDQTPNNTEWTLLIKLTTADSAGTVNIVKVHRTIVEHLIAADATLYLKTKQGNKISSSQHFPKGNEYESTFEHKETRKQFIVAHTVGSTKTLDELKRQNLPLLNYLKEQNVFLDKSASGSLTEVVLGPWFGIHPDLTSKDRLRFDLVKLIACHGQTDGGFYSKLQQAKASLTFPGCLPPFQLRTRRIQRTVDDIEYSAKTTSFICASEHRIFWESVLIDGISGGWLAPLGRFYLLQRDDHSDDLISGIIWHNRMLTKMKAIIIHGVHTHIMDAAVRAPHSMEERPTLREQIHKGGFITILSTKDRSKWIGIAQNAETATNWVNKNMQDLCSTVYTDGTNPVASDPEPRVRQPRHARGQNDDKTALFDKQSKSWADITRHDNDEDSGNYTTSNIAKRVPNVVRFKSKVRFEITEVLVDTTPTPEADEDTKMSATDGLTTITQDDLRTMKDELCAQFKDEISSAISGMSSSSEAKTSNEQFQSQITDQITRHNDEMHETMKSMRSMMTSMHRMVEKTLSTAHQTETDSSGDPEPTFHDSHSIEEPRSPMPQPACPDSPMMLTQPQSKRKSTVAKGESPASKLAHTGGGRNAGRGRGGRWETASHNANRRSMRQKSKVSSFDPSEFDAIANQQLDPMEVSDLKKPPPILAPPKKSSLARNLAADAFASASANPFDPLAKSEAPSASGSS